MKSAINFHLDSTVMRGAIFNVAVAFLMVSTGTINTLAAK